MSIHNNTNSDEFSTKSHTILHNVRHSHTILNNSPAILLNSTEFNYNSLQTPAVVAAWHYHSDIVEIIRVCGHVRVCLFVVVMRVLFVVM